MAHAHMSLLKLVLIQTGCGDPGELACLPGGKRCGLAEPLERIGAQSVPLADWNMLLRHLGGEPQPSQWEAKYHVLHLL